jgi:TRAP-type mannitol/chloroaromatic compound transport system permease small subunit
VRRLLRISDGIDRALVRIGSAAGVLFLALMAVILLDVGTRGQGWVSSTKLQELEWHLHAALTFLVFAATYVQDRHVRIEVFRDRWSPRTRAVVELGGLLILFLPMCAVVLYYSSQMAMTSFVRGEASPSVTGLGHRWIIRSFQPLAFLLLVLAGFSVFVRNLAILRGAAVDAGASALAPEAVEELRV